MSPVVWEMIRSRTDFRTAGRHFQRRMHLHTAGGVPMRLPYMVLAGTKDFAANREYRLSSKCLSRYDRMPLKEPHSRPIPMTAVPFVLRRMLPCLLALCLASLGPAALAGLPRTVNVNAEEETRSHAEHSVGVISSAIRMSRSAGSRHRSEHSRWRSASCVGRRLSLDRPADTLRTLQVRTQV